MAKIELTLTVEDVIKAVLQTYFDEVFEPGDVKGLTIGKGKPLPRGSKVVLDIEP